MNDKESIVEAALAVLFFYWIFKGAFWCIKKLFKGTQAAARIVQENHEYYHKHGRGKPTL